MTLTVDYLVEVGIDYKELEKRAKHHLMGLLLDALGDTLPKLCLSFTRCTNKCEYDERMQRYTITLHYNILE